jgi:uncharacterized protein YerC
MKLPIIKQFVNFAEEKDIDFLHDTLSTLENLIECDRISDQELDVIGELMSNLSAAIEVTKEIQEGKSKTDAINGFMKRVMGSIDK